MNIPVEVKRAVDDGSFIWLAGRDGLQVWCEPAACEPCGTMRSLFIVRQTITENVSTWDCRCYLCAVETPHAPTAVEMEDLFRAGVALERSTSRMFQAL